MHRTRCVHSGGRGATRMVHALGPGAAARVAPAAASEPEEGAVAAAQDHPGVGAATVRADQEAAHASEHPPCSQRVAFAPGSEGRSRPLPKAAGPGGANEGPAGPAGTAHPQKGGLRSTEAGFDALVREAEAAAFRGWDFSWLDGRLDEEPRPWDWAAVVRSAFPGVRALLDVGTGGGERLAGLAPLPPETSATEGYPPNVPVARARLEPLGVSVVAVDAEKALPFPDDAFDLVTDRHLGCPPSQVCRILRPGGQYITEQVGTGHYRELRGWFGGPAARNRRAVPSRAACGAPRRKRGSP